MQSDFRGATPADIEDVQDLTLRELERLLKAAEEQLRRFELDAEINPGEFETLQRQMEHRKEELAITRQQFANSRQKAAQPVAAVAT